MCFYFPRRRKPRAPQKITTPLDSTSLESTPPSSYAPRPIYIAPPPAATLPTTIITTATLPTTVTTTTTRRSYQPTFPLSPIPSCRHCHRTPQYRSTVAFTNENGNGGRPYYVCTQCKTNARTTSGANGKGWITWDDNIGVKPGNPLCDCDFITREDRTGVYSSTPGRGFWTCCTGACGYHSWRAD